MLGVVTGGGGTGRGSGMLIPVLPQDPTARPGWEDVIFCLGAFLGCLPSIIFIVKKNKKKQKPKNMKKKLKKKNANVKCNFYSSDMKYIL